MILFCFTILKFSTSGLQLPKLEKALMGITLVHHCIYNISSRFGILQICRLIYVLANLYNLVCITYKQNF